MQRSYHLVTSVGGLLLFLLCTHLITTLVNAQPLLANQQRAARGTQPLADISQIAAGGSHTCALTTVGTVFCWGQNNHGQLGDGTLEPRTAPVAVPGLQNVAAIALGDAHSCALTTDATLRCWGQNNYGQLGDGTDTDRRLPSAGNALSGITAIAAGDHHTCATAAGGLYCWGQNETGQLGDGTEIDRNMPTRVSALKSTVIALAGGARHTCARTADQRVYCWGDNWAGQLGDGTTTNEATPVHVNGISGEITALAAGWNHSCAATEEKTYCWGNNWAGQLGDGTTGTRSTPAVVSNLANGVTMLAAGEAHTCARTADGQVSCWGANWLGQLGDGTVTDHTRPMPVGALGSDVTTIAGGRLHSCAVTTGGNAFCWGSNSLGQLGYGAPVPTIPQEIDTLSDVTAIAAGTWHTCAQTDGGAVHCWGSNEGGKLGDGTHIDRMGPVAVSGLRSGVTALATGGQHTCAAQSSGVLCWGWNPVGQMGTKPSSAIPVTVDGVGSDVIALAAGYEHTCARLNSGEVTCWGGNSVGQLGDGTTTSRGTPMAVQGLSNGVTALITGNWHSCARTGDGDTGGTLACWGNNEYGQLGDGTTISRTTPVTVSALGSDVTLFTAGDKHTCALTTTGMLSCWGFNGAGQLGDGGTVERAFPAAVVGLDTDVTALAAGESHTCAVTASGVYCWGGNWYGQLGDGSTASQSAPVLVNGLQGETVLALAAGRDHTCALTTAGTVHCWGHSENGQLGNGHAWRTQPVAVVTLSSPAPTATPTSATPPTVTPTVPATLTLTPTPTAPPPGPGDLYETDDTCTQAHTIPTDGTTQTHTFHQMADEDWVRFDTVADQRYLIHVDVPHDSPADVALQLKGACGSAVEQTQDFAFSPGVQLEFTAPGAGPVHLQLTNHEAATAGAHVRYTLSVRQLDTTTQPGVLILVAGKIRDNDTVQPNIYFVTDSVYQLFRDNGYSDDDIYYLAPDVGHPYVDAAASAENLRLAITDWAARHVNATRALTIYLMDHGSRETLYLDKQRGQWVTPTQLDTWLTQLEAQHPGLAVNIIVEACYAGTFITAPESVSKPGRVVIASTDDRSLAWATERGASFSDHFLRALRQGKSLYGSFVVARDAAAAAIAPQQAWLDGDGDGNPHDDGAQTIAAQRGFAFAGTFPDDIWPPYIKTIELGTIENGRGRLRAQILDDVRVDHTWAVIYGPDYQPPTEGEALVQETLPTVTLLAEGNGWYSAYYDGFQTPGDYQIVFHAEDNQDLAARPVAHTVQNGSQLFLPAIMR